MQPSLAQARVSFRIRPNFVSKLRAHFTKFRARSTQISGVFCFALGYSAIALALARSARIDTHLPNIVQYLRTCYTAILYTNYVQLNSYGRNQQSIVSASSPLATSSVQPPIFPVVIIIIFYLEGVMRMLRMRGRGDGGESASGPKFRFGAMRRSSALRTCTQISVKNFDFVGPPKFCKTFRETLAWAKA